MAVLLLVTSCGGDPAATPVGDPAAPETTTAPVTQEGDSEPDTGFPGSTQAPSPPVGDRTVEAFACQSAPLLLSDHTDQEPLHLACAETGTGMAFVAHATSGGILLDDEVEPAPDLADRPQCLTVFNGPGAAGSCGRGPDDAPPPVIYNGVGGEDNDDGGGEGAAIIGALVPEGTTHVTGVTSLGTELVGLPYDLLVVLWWNPSEGELAEVVAETPDGAVTLYRR